MVYAQLGNIRLASIHYIASIEDNSTLHFKEKSIAEGLGLEATCDGKTWYVIAWIRYDDGVAKLESVGDRFIDHLNSDNVEDIKFLFYRAEKMITDVCQDLDD